MTTQRPSHARPDVPSEWVVDGLGIHFIRGNRSSRDVCVLVETRRPTMLTMAQVGAIIVALYRNEDRVVPHGDGGEMVLDFLRVACDRGIREACAIPRFKLRPPIIERGGLK